VQHSADEPDKSSDTGLAIAAEVLYISNLLLLPGLSFLILMAVYFSKKDQASALAASHLSQTFVASLWAGIMLILVNGLILLLGGYNGSWTWVILITYFTVCHSAFVMLGILGLAKAMAGQCWRYTLIGPKLPDGCGNVAG
jgi:uncharacterized membrane protein